MANEFDVELEKASVIRLNRLMKEIEEGVKDLDSAGAWQAVSEILSEKLEELFDKQGALGGPRWSALSPFTIQRRTRLNLTPIRIGWARGRMGPSLIEPTHPDAVEIRRAKEFVRGTAAAARGKKGQVSYPSIFARGRSGQPPRPIFGRLFRRGNRRILKEVVDAIEKNVFPVDKS